MKNYNPGKHRPLIQIVARLVQNNPSLADNSTELIKLVEAEIPELKNKTRCANCDASMLENIFLFDILDAILLLTMAQDIQLKKIEGMDFTEANKCHVPTLDASNAVRCRTTRAAKLGLIAKYLDDKGKHERGMWVITRRGWSALRGELIPEGVKVWRNRILDHLGEQTNMYKVMHQYKDKIASAKHKSKDFEQEADYIKRINFYDANEWVKWGEVQQGRLGL